MKYFTHSLGKLGTGIVDVKSGQLTIISNDMGEIGRVFKSGRQTMPSPYGRGWSLNIPSGVHGTISLCGGKIKEFTDNKSENYGFYYNCGLLSAVVSGEGMVTYDYNADGMLTRVTYPDGTSVSISYRDIYYIHDITVCDKNSNGILAVSYADYYYNNKIGCVYEYDYCGKERVERAFTEITDTGIATLSHTKKSVLYGQ